MNQQRLVASRLPRTSQTSAKRLRGTACAQAARIADHGRFAAGSDMAMVTLATSQDLCGQRRGHQGRQLDVGDGQFCVLVGPSGCGKSTLLRMVAGLETITSGEIDIGGRVVNEVEPAERDIAMVFQNYALYPHMRVYNNMAYGLRNRGMAKPEIDPRRARPRACSKSARCSTASREQLSGGQRQRVAMGRAIVRQPKVFLFDEPLSNLDAKLRIAMRVEIRKLQRRLGTTSIYVTHDQLEAMTLADILVVMNGGLVEQIGNPLDIYQKPATTFVASFIGAPPMNLMPLQGRDARARRRSGRAEAGILGIRPEDFVLSNDGRRQAASRSTSSSRRSSGSAPKPLSTASRQQGAGRSAKPGELPPGEVIVRVPGAVGPAIGERIGPLRRATSCICSAPTAASGSIPRPECECRMGCRRLERSRKIMLHIDLDRLA